MAEVPGVVRRTNRAREIFVKAMVEATAQERITRAVRHKTRLDARAQEFVVGDQVEFHVPVNPDT